MLTITVLLDNLEEVKLEFEHSLVSLSKWEAIYEKAFFGREPMNEEETKTYIKQMLVSPSPIENWIDLFSLEHYAVVNDYINSKQSATWFRESQSPSKSGEVVTAELIYYWMINFQIPFECETWHLNRLMTLIRVCGIKQAKPKKMSRQAQAEEYRRLNALRREQLGTSG